MEKHQPYLRKYISDVVLFMAFVVTKNCLEKIEDRINKDGKEEIALKRKLTMTYLVYHALGIFYNE